MAVNPTIRVSPFFKLNFSSDAEVSAAASSYIAANDPDLMFLHFDDVDHEGHAGELDCDAVGRQFDFTNPAHHDG